MARAPKKRRSEEDPIHFAIVELLRFKADPRTIYYHCPNGETRSKRTGAKLKRMGVVKGVPDLCFVLPDGRAAFIEIKAEKGTLTVEQRVFRDRCEAQGIPYAVVRSSLEVERVLEAWGALRRRRWPSEAREAA